jgi:hypothetical protein
MISAVTPILKVNDLEETIRTHWDSLFVHRP